MCTFLKNFGNMYVSLRIVITMQNLHRNSKIIKVFTKIDPWKNVFAINEIYKFYRLLKLFIISYIVLFLKFCVLLQFGEDIFLFINMV